MNFHDVPLVCELAALGIFPDFSCIPSATGAGKASVVRRCNALGEVFANSLLVNLSGTTDSMPSYHLGENCLSTRQRFTE